MIARLLVVVAFIAGSAALALDFVAPSSEVAQAQSSDDDLIATIEALQTQVADQEQRLDDLEETQQALLLVLAMGNSTGDGLVPALTPAASDNATKHTLTGTILVFGSGDYPTGETGTACAGQRDVVKGAKVSVSSTRQRSVEETTLEPGVVEDGACAFRFSVEVSDQEDYVVDIAEQNSLNYTRDYMESNNWKIKTVASTGR